MREMQVEFKDVIDRVKLEDVPVGTVFRYYEAVLLKTAEKGIDGSIRCVNVAAFQGTMREFAPDKMVEPLEAVLTIFERRA